MSINCRLLVGTIILLIFIPGCTPKENSEAVIENTLIPYLGQTPPGLTPEVFAPGMVSTDSAIEFSSTFSPDGTEFYFTRRFEGEKNILYETHFMDGTWSDPAPVTFTNGLEACEPFIVVDNKTIYFSVFTNDTSAIWAADRIASGWSEPRFVGEGMFVTSDQNGNFYVTSFATGRPSINQVNLVDGLFTDYLFVTSGVHPFIAPDGGYLIYDNGDGNFQARFQNEDGTWGTPKALASQGIPTTASIGAISPDGQYFFYVYQQDIYWVSTEVITNLK